MGKEDKKIIPKDKKPGKEYSEDRERLKKHRGDNLPRNWPKPQEKNKGHKF